MLADKDKSQFEYYILSVLTHPKAGYGFSDAAETCYQCRRTHVLAAGAYFISLWYGHTVCHGYVHCRIWNGFHQGSFRCCVFYSHQVGSTMPVS